VGGHNFARYPSCSPLALDLTLICFCSCACVSLCALYPSTHICVSIRLHVCVCVSLIFHRDSVLSLYFLSLRMRCTDTDKALLLILEAMKGLVGGLKVSNHTRTYTRAHAHTLSLSRSLSRAHSHTHTHTRFPSLSPSHLCESTHLCTITTHVHTRATQNITTIQT